MDADFLVKFATSSHLSYQKLKGSKASQDYYLLKLKYQNLSGVLSSISILKKIAKGEKIISTRPKKVTVKQIKKLEKPSKKLDRVIDANTEYSKIGITTSSEWNALIKKYHQFLQERIKLLDNLITIESKKEPKDQIYLHFADRHLLLDQLNGVLENHSSDVHFMPKGLRIMIGESSILEKYLAKLKSGLRKKLSLDLDDTIKYLYEIIPSKSKILKIDNCKKLQKLYTTYKNKDPSNLAKVLNWERIYQDYDGLIINPWMNLDCSQYLKKLEVVNNEDFNKIMSLMAVGKISDEEMEEIKMVVWQSGFGMSSGCIWKTSPNLKIKALIS
jgi:hypothetical protein